MVVMAAIFQNGCQIYVLLQEHDEKLHTIMYKCEFLCSIQTLNQQHIFCGSQIVLMVFVAATFSKWPPKMLFILLEC